MLTHAASCFVGRPRAPASLRALDGGSMTPPPLAIQLFGPLRVTVGGEPLPRLRTRSVEWLLALLTLRHGRAVSRSWLAGTLWPESSGSRALQNLRNDLMRLRQALGPERDRKSTRLNSSHSQISYAVFC